MRSFSARSVDQGIELVAKLIRRHVELGLEGLVDLLVFRPPSEQSQALEAVGFSA